MQIRQIIHISQQVYEKLSIYFDLLLNIKSLSILQRTTQNKKIYDYRYFTNLTNSMASHKNVQLSFDQLLMAKKNERKFIPTIQSILSNKQICHSVKLAASNIIKTLIERELFEAQQPLQKKQLLVGSKAYIVNQINQIVKDQNIKYFYKAPAIDGYVKITMMNNGSNNLQKIIRAMKFYYANAQQIISVLMTSSVLKCKYLNIKYQSDLYQQTFPMLLSTFQKFVKAFYTPALWRLKQTFEVIKSVIQEVDFVKFPRLPIIYLNSASFLKIIEYFCIQIVQPLTVNQQIVKEMHILIQNDMLRNHKVSCYQMLSKIIGQGLRVNLQKECLQQIPKVVNIVKSVLLYLQDQVICTNYCYNNQNINRSILSAIKVISLSIKTRIQSTLGQKQAQTIASMVNIQWLMNSTIFLIQQFIKRHSLVQSPEEHTLGQEYNEFFNFWDDAANEGESQVIQIQFNNLLLAYVEHNLDKTIKQYLDLIRPYTLVTFEPYNHHQMGNAKNNQFQSSFPDNPFHMIVNRQQKAIVKSISQCDKKTRNMILIIPSLLLKVFMRYPHAEKQIQSLILNNYETMFIFDIHSNSEQKFQQLVMFLMLIYNYSDDILQDENSNKLYIVLIQQAFKINQLIQNHIFIVKRQSKHNSKIHLLGFIYRKIIYRYFSYGFPYESQIPKIESFLKLINQKNSLAMIQIASIVIKNYSSKIKETFCVQQIRQLMNKIALIYNQIALTEYDVQSKSTIIRFVTSCANNLLIKFLPQFFSIEGYKSSFEQLLENIKQFISVVSRKTGMGCQLKMGFENMFPILQKSIGILKQIPSGYQKIIYECQFSIEGPLSFQALNMFIVYAKQESPQHFKFVKRIIWKCVAYLNKCIRGIQQIDSENNKKSCTGNKIDQSKLDMSQLHSLLLIHIGIYYHHQCFQNQLIEQLIIMLDLQFRRKGKCFDFVEGKYQLIMIMLLRFQFEKVHYLLKRISESQLSHISSELITQEANNRNGQHRNKMVAYQLIYNVVFYNQNVYRIEYDATVFVTCQLQILQNFLRPDSQCSIMLFKYAHISLLSVIWNIQRIYKKKVDKNTQDELLLYQQLVPQTGLQRDFYHVVNTIKLMQLPLSFQNSQSDQFQKFNHFLQKLLSSDQGIMWYQKMVQNYLSKQTKIILANIKQYKKVNGNYRKILTVQKRIRQQHMQPNYQNQRKLLD